MCKYMCKKYIYIYKYNIYIYIIHIYIYISLETENVNACMSLARPKRRRQNACSGTRVPNAGGVFSGFWLQKPPNPFLAPCKMDPLSVSHRVLQFCFFLDLTTIKFVRGQNLFCFSQKKDPELGRSTFWWLHPPVWAHTGKRESHA